jgi:hypothetical protein
MAKDFITLPVTIGKESTYIDISLSLTQTYRGGLEVDVVIAAAADRIAIKILGMVQHICRWRLWMGLEAEEKMSLP